MKYLYFILAFFANLSSVLALEPLLYINLDAISHNTKQRIYIDTDTIKSILSYYHINSGDIDIKNWKVPSVSLINAGETVFPFITDTLDGKHIYVAGQQHSVLHGYKVPYYWLFPVLSKDTPGNEVELDDRFVYLCLDLARKYNANIYVGTRQQFLDSYIHSNTEWICDLNLWQYIGACLVHYFGFTNKQDYWINRDLTNNPEDVGHTLDTSVSFQFKDKFFVIEEVPKMAKAGTLQPIYKTASTKEY